jgi:hypothetical protein
MVAVNDNVNQIAQTFNTTTYYEAIVANNFVYDYDIKLVNNANANHLLGYQLWGTGALVANANANAYTGFYEMRTYHEGNTADLLNSSDSTSLQVNQAGTSLTVTQPIGVLFTTISYGSSNTSLDSSVGIRFQRRRGNNASRLSVQPNDYLGNLEWRGSRGSGTFVTNRTAKIAPRVDSTYVANGTAIPVGFEFIVCNSTANITHNMYANGVTNFAGNVIAANLSAGSITGTLTTNAQPNITSVGNLNTLITNSLTAGNIFCTGAGNTISGNLQGTFVTLLLDNVNTAIASFNFSTYNNSNSLINPYTFFRARGNLTNPAAVQVGDIIRQESYSVYADSGNTFKSSGGYTVDVSSNDGLGNITTNARLFGANDGVGCNLTLSYDTIKFANSANATVYANGLFKSVSANIGNGNIDLYANGDIDATGRLSYLRTYGDFYSNATQTSAGANTVNYMTLNNTGLANGVSIANSDEITIARTGDYNIQFSAQLSHDTNQTANVEIWLAKNGNNLANTNTRLTLVKDEAVVASWNWLVNANTANDYYQIAWASSDTNVELVYVDAGNTIANVAIPSVIVTVVPVGA